MPPPTRFASPAANRAFAAKAVPLQRKQSKDIAKLTPPKGDRAKVKALLAELDQAIDTMEQDPQMVADAGRLFADANQAALAYGLKICGR